MRHIAALAGVATVLAACTAAPAPAPPTATTTVTATATTTASPSPSPSPTPTVPPVRPSTPRGSITFVQPAEDASLVSGDDPIRLTLARTANRASWFSEPPQRLTGVSSTDDMMRMLGWRPADDGTTASLPTPLPNAMLTSATGTLAFTIRQANVRADGTLVLDIAPMGPQPPTTASLGPVTLTIDGAPGVTVIETEISPTLSARVIVTGGRNQQALVQFVDSSPDAPEPIATSRFLAPDLPSVEFELTAGTTSIEDADLTLTPPTRRSPGQVSLTGTLVVDGVSTDLAQVLGRWQRPAR